MQSPPAFSLHSIENCNLETGYQRSDASWKARAPCVRAPHRVEPAHWAPAASICEHSGMLDRVSGARTLGRLRRRTASDSEMLQGGSPAARARLTQCLCQGFSFAPWGSIATGVANCCCVGSTPTFFFSLRSFSPKLLIHRLRE